MNTTKYVYWQDEQMWLGYLEEYPDYRTQGETKEELEENLRDIYSELTSGNIPCVRRVDRVACSSQLPPQMRLAANRLAWKAESRLRFNPGEQI